MLPTALYVARKSLPYDEKCLWGILGPLHCPPTFPVTVTRKKKGIIHPVLLTLSSPCGIFNVMFLADRGVSSWQSLSSDSEKVDGDNIAPQAKRPVYHTLLSVVRTSEAAAS
jgi:hypothetical protein